MEQAKSLLVIVRTVLPGITAPSGLAIKDHLSHPSRFGIIGMSSLRKVQCVFSSSSKDKPWRSIMSDTCSATPGRSHLACLSPLKDCKALLLSCHSPSQVQVSLLSIRCAGNACSPFCTCLPMIPGMLLPKVKSV